MQTYFENKLAFAAIFLFCALPAASHGTKSNGPPLAANQRTTSSAAQLSHGPNMPPDPWDWNKVQHGPNMPPDPWDWSAANHGPNMPPDPWDWNKVKAQHGPNMPPDPWDWIISA
jgi:hypothetical protein